MAGFAETTYKSATFKVEHNASRILEVAIPPIEMTGEQAKVFQEIADYAAEKGIEFVTVIVN